MRHSDRTVLENSFWYVAGLAFLALAKAKHAARGYVTPKPFGLDEIARCVAYDRDLAGRFLTHIAALTNFDLRGKRVLELGPGSDLGVGLLLVAKGASNYVGFDRHALAAGAPTAFYEALAEATEIDLTALHDGRVQYRVREDFDIVAGVDGTFDLIISNAAFEHFDDVPSVVAQISEIARDDAAVIAEVDLQTHSRWIRDADPNNIYRYPDWLYRLFAFPGQPNRVRPHTYRQLFHAQGWERIALAPANRLPSNLRARRVHRRFDGQHLDWLSFVIHATRGSVGAYPGNEHAG